MLNKYNTSLCNLKRQDLVVLRQVLLVDHILFIMPKLQHYGYIPKRQEIDWLDQIWTQIIHGDQQQLL